VLNLALHTLRWNGPALELQIDFPAPRARNLLKPGRVQYPPLERSRGDAFAESEVDHEGTEPRVRERWMMALLAFLQPRRRRQLMPQVAFPARRIGALPVTFVGRPVEDAFHSATYARGGLGLRRPNRPQNLQDVVGGHGTGMKLSDDRKRVGPESREPLLTVFPRFPSPVPAQRCRSLRRTQTSERRRPRDPTAVLPYGVRLAVAHAATSARLAPSFPNSNAWTWRCRSVPCWMDS